MNIILCGLPACGKTTIGKKTAEALKWNFIDTDTLIESAYTQLTNENASCRQIYLKEGEAVFRALESQQINSLKGSSHCIIAVGGGSLTSQENREILQEIGILIYLKINSNIVWHRIQSREIPSYLDSKDLEESFYALAEKRIPIFESAAKLIIDTNGLTEEEIVNLILTKQLSA